MSSSMPPNSAGQGDDIPEKPPGSKDIGWQFGKLVKKNNQHEVQCRRCTQIFRGGINRIKQHIAGTSVDVKSCFKATDEDRSICRQNLDGIRMKKMEKKKADIELRQEVQISHERESIDAELAHVGSNKPRVFGPLDRLVDDGKLKQTTLDEGERKKWRALAHHYVALWCYAAGIPFHTLDLPEFDLMCEAIGKYGPGYKGPSQYQLRVPLLKEAYEKVEGELKKQKQAWEEYGCSILTDGWTDKKHRSVMNLCVHCKEGTSFIKSIEDSDKPHTGDYIFKWVEECILEVGESRVIQVVTDSHASNMYAKEMMKVTRPRLFWSSCAAHTIDLMLEGIGKISKYKSVIE